MSTVPMVGADGGHCARVALDNAAKRAAFQAWLADQWAALNGGAAAAHAVADGCKALCAEEGAS